MKFSNRITSMQASPIRRLVPYAEKAKRTRKKVYPLNIGQPDIKTPFAFFEALGNFDKEVLAYDVSQGNPELIKAISDYYKTYNMDFQEDEILMRSPAHAGSRPGR